MNFCKYNDGVTCEPAKRHCATCGWSPDEAKRRRDTPGAKKVKNPQQGPTKSKRVAKVDARGQVLEIYFSENMAAKQNGVSRTSVRARCEGKATQFSVDLGFSFKYID